MLTRRAFAFGRRNEGVMLDWNAIKELASELLGGSEESHLSLIIDMYEDLEGVQDPIDSGRLIHVDRATSYMIDGIDCRIVEVDANKPKRDLVAMFYMFSARGMGSSSFGAGADSLDIEELRMLLRTLNIVPAVMSSQEACHYFNLALVKMEKERASTLKAKAEDNVSFKAMFSEGPTANALDPDAFLYLMKLIARHLHVHSSDITKVFVSPPCPHPNLYARQMWNFVYFLLPGALCFRPQSF